MSDDTGRPNQSGLLGACDCMTLWTQRAAQAAGLEHETLCAIMSEAQSMAEAGTPPHEIIHAMRHWSDTLFTVIEAGNSRNRGWVILAWDYPAPKDPARYRVPVAFSPAGWER